MFHQWTFCCTVLTLQTRMKLWNWAVKLRNYCTKCIIIDLWTLTPKRMISSQDIQRQQNWTHHGCPWFWDFWHGPPNSKAIMMLQFVSCLHWLQRRSNHAMTELLIQQNWTRTITLDTHRNYLQIPVLSLCRQDKKYTLVQLTFLSAYQCILHSSFFSVVTRIHSRGHFSPLHPSSLTMIGQRILHYGGEMDLYTCVFCTKCTQIGICLHRSHMVCHLKLLTPVSQNDVDSLSITAFLVV
jgi:hypothetical protein